jgi:hypothetical protein
VDTINKRPRTSRQNLLEIQHKGVSAMNNKLIDLNNHLFAQLEKLSDEELSPEKLIVEMNRSKSMVSIAQTIINNAKLALDAHVALGDVEIGKIPMIGCHPGD